jgi:hypothetical protein
MPHFVGSRAVVGTLFTLVLGLSLVEARGAPSPGPAPSPQAEASPAAAAASPTVTPSPSAAPSPSATLSARAAKQWLTEFTRAQRTELKALEHRHQLELRELKASQAARFKEFWQREREQQRAYFKTTEKGVEKRDYVHRMNERRQQFQTALKAEFAQRRQQQAVRAQAVRKDQETRLLEARKYLDRGERPPAWVWPAPGA